MSAVKKIKNKNQEFVKDLSEKGYDDVLILKRDTAEKVTTEKRMKLLEEIRNSEIESVRDLARKVNRDPSIVSKDLKILYQAEVIEFEKQKGSKIPRIKHKNIFPEPIALQK